MNNKEYLEKYEKLFNEINCDHSEYSNISYDDINIANYRGIYAISIDDPKSFEEFGVMAEHQFIRNHINDYPLRKNLTSCTQKLHQYQRNLDITRRKY